MNTQPNLKIGKYYINDSQYNAQTEDDLKAEAASLFLDNHEVEDAFLELHGEDYDLEDANVLNDFCVYNSYFDNYLDQVKEQYNCIEVKEDSDLKSIFVDAESLFELNEIDIKKVLDMLELEYREFVIEIPISDLDYESYPAFLFPNGDDSLVSFPYQQDELLTLKEFQDVLNEVSPNSDTLNVVKHKLDLNNTDVKLLMMNFKDADSRFDTSEFYIEKNDIERYKNNELNITEIKIYDTSFNSVSHSYTTLNPTDDVNELTLHNVIVRDYINSSSNKLTADKMQSLVDRHSPTTNEPKQDVRKSLRNKM